MRSTIALLLLASTSMLGDWRTAAFCPKCSRASTTSQHKYDKQEHASSAPIAEPLYWSQQRTANQGKAWRRYKPWPNH